MRHFSNRGRSISDLKHQLREAELENELTSVTATLHGIKPATTSTKLGPTPTARVQLEGAEAEALLDTGSPVSIVSLQFLLEVLAKQRQKDRSPAAWRAMVEQRLESPTVTLQNYTELPILRQIKVNISKPGFTAIAGLVQVQNEAPTKLLIGTDLLPQLGLLFIQTKQDGEDVDLLNKKPKLEAEQDTQLNLPSREADQMSALEKSEHKSQEGNVRLFQAIEKLLRAQVEQQITAPLVLFEPEDALRGENRLAIAEAVTQPDNDSRVTLIILNEGIESARLKKRQVLGI